MLDALIAASLITTLILMFFDVKWRIAWLAPQIFAFAIGIVEYVQGSDLINAIFVAVVVAAVNLLYYVDYIRDQTGKE